ncbi:peptide deformylase [Candidatus Uabimicrobium amorphum]|uniref:Peptide deformylase n=1 Tax=Uabimicrobium amorphum TaxID=2596890 RepID=A0A5S9IJQ5_UABAM|nr:peptide deformylase [Candidatus Uabimicrobium amorphum]BBM82797.1 peptide deformylase [Candidatus Uabimicrobium amorphum]
MAKQLRIYHYPHPVLKQQAQPVSNIADKQIQTFIDDLAHTCELAKGMGIAAPQVGYSLRIFILMSHPNPRYPYAPVMPTTAVINPEIIEYGSQQISDWEGCLSIPDKRGQVPRSETIYVKYTDRYGEEVFADFEGFIARVFQHEYDHLQGTMFFERMKENRLYTNVEFHKIIGQ